MLMRWKRLGHITEPGTLPLPGVGIIHITQEDINAAKTLGGNPTFDLIDCSSADGPREYRIGRFDPNA